MNILAVINGEYGRRHVENIQQHAPAHWQIEVWQAPAILPRMIDDPQEHLPPAMRPADLILSFAEIKGVAELLPEMAVKTGARAVVVAVDNETWLPRGLARQLHGWLEALNVACATPKPLCTLTETDYKITRRQRESYHSELIAEFARYFGQPQIQLTVDAETRFITAAEVRRDASCGCTRYIAQRLVGTAAAEALDKATLLHHHFPCLASMVKLDDYDHETLMMESGNMLCENIAQQL